MKRQEAFAAIVLAMAFASFEARSAQPCCAVTSIDTRTGVVSAQDKASRRGFEFKLDNPVLLRKVKVGQAVDANFGSGKVTIDGISGRFSIVGGAPASQAAAPAPPPAPQQRPATPPSIGTAPSTPPPQRPATPPTPGSAPAPQPQPARPSSTIPPSIGSPAPAAPATPAISPPLQRPAPTIGGSAPSATGDARALASGPDASPRAPATLKPAEPCCAVTAVDTRSGVVTAQENASKRQFGVKVDNAILLNRIRPGHAVDADLDAAKATFQGMSGRFAIVAAPQAGPAVGVADRAPGRDPLRPAPAGGPAAGMDVLAKADPKAGARTRKTYQLPQLTIGAPEVRTERDKGRAHRAIGRGVRQLRDMDEIESSGLPQSAKIVMMMHALTLPENASSHYIVNEEMAREWAKTHKVPDEMKPKKKKKKKKKCDWTHSGGCKDKVQQAAQDLWDSASDDWKRAWKANTKNLQEAWDEVEECFADHTLSAGNIPVKFDIAPQFPVSLDKSSSSSSGSGSSSGKAKGTLTVGLPVQADFTAQVEVFYIPCLPFAIRPKSVGADGTMTVAAKLGAQVTASGNFSNEYTIPPGGGPAIPIAVLPIVIGGIPVATLDVALYVDGTVRVGGEGNLDGRFQLLAPYRNNFDFECNGRGCRGRMKNVPVPTTTTENVLLKGTVHVQPAIYTALQLSLNFDALSGRAGPQPFLYGEVRGCSATAAMQNTSGQSSAQEYHALTADLDWGIEFRAEALVAGEQVAEYVKEVMARRHIWFGDIAPGGSTAMSPAVKGPSQVAVGAAAEYQFQSRPCYPYAEAVDYRVTWAGGAAPSAQQAGGARRVSMRPGGGTAASSTCDMSGASGSCTLKPGAGGAVSLAWPQAGAHSVTVTPLRDRHGREFKSDRATQLNVNVQ